jgi:hypothetical protein
MILRTVSIQRKLIASQDMVIECQKAQIECMKEIVDSADRQRELVETENGMLKDLCKLERDIDIPDL